MVKAYKIKNKKFLRKLEKIGNVEYFEEIDGKGKHREFVKYKNKKIYLK